MTRRPLSTAILAALYLAAPAAAFARGYMTTGFRTLKSRPMTIAVLPPRADFVQAKVVVTDQMRAESAALGREAGEALRNNLEVLGYKVRLLAPRDIENDADLRALVAKVNERFAEEWGKLAYRPRAVKQERFTTGEDTVNLASLLKVDGLAVARVIAVVQTTQRTYGRVDVGILNGRLGRVEGFFTGSEATTPGRLTGKPAKVMGQAIENALTRYPASSEKDNYPDDIPLPASETRKPGKEAPPDDVAAIRDFEVLIKGQGASSKPSAAKTAESRQATSAKQN